jgi:hypothetical protein
MSNLKKNITKLYIKLFSFKTKRNLKISKYKCYDKVLNELSYQIDNNKKLYLFELDVDNFGFEREISLSPIFSKFKNNKYIIQYCIEYLFENSFIDINQDESIPYMMNNSIFFKKIYYCNYITKLGEMKMQNGGFYKEYLEECKEKRDKRYNRFTFWFFIITVISSVVDIIITICN